MLVQYAVEQWRCGDGQSTGAVVVCCAVCQAPRVNMEALKGQSSRQSRSVTSSCKRRASAPPLRLVARVCMLGCLARVSCRNKRPCALSQRAGSSQTGYSEAKKQTQRRRWAAVCCACRANILWPLPLHGRCGEGMQATMYGRLTPDSVRFRAAARQVCEITGNEMAKSKSWTGTKPQ